MIVFCWFKRNEINKTEITKAIADNAGFTIKDATKFLNAFTEVTTEVLAKGDDVALVGFGTFARVERSARRARDFQTGKNIKVAASKGVKFKAGKNVKDAVN